MLYHVLFSSSQLVRCFNSLMINDEGCPNCPSTCSTGLVNLLDALRVNMWRCRSIAHNLKHHNVIKRPFDQHPGFVYIITPTGILRHTCNCDLTCFADICNKSESSMCSTCNGVANGQCKQLHECIWLESVNRHKHTHSKRRTNKRLNHEACNNSSICC